MNLPVLLGVPYDETSSHLRGAALAPAAIRAALASNGSSLWSESGLDVGARGVLHDAGDVAWPDPAGVDAAITSSVAALLRAGQVPVVLGGDHWITYPVLEAMHERYGELSVLHLDAHPDLYDAFGGSPRSHACPFARACETGLVQRLVQVGIRNSNGHQRAQAARFGVETITMQAWHRGARPVMRGPTYVSLDLDVLDPAFAPGVSHPEPGGLSTRDVIALLQDLDAPIIGADIVELNPAVDVGSLTANAAAKLLKELVAVIHR